MNHKNWMVLSFAAFTLLASEKTEAYSWDTYSDTWAATDALGRRLPGYAEVGGGRAERFVGIFYFLWLGAHVQGGPFDITKIRAQNPAQPAWGPWYAPHHWGESLFGYYLTQDPWVLRKHAQMLADAGVDTLIFDVTNQLTYKANYMELLRVFDEVRRNGGKTPQVAFLCPFWQPTKVVAELWKDLYEPNLYPDLWFRWKGKPLILADPGQLPQMERRERRELAVELEAGHTLGQSFTVAEPIEKVGCCIPTWGAARCAATLSLLREGPEGERLASQRFTNLTDNGWITLSLASALGSGRYYLQLSEPEGKAGWWSSTNTPSNGGQAFAEGKVVPGERSLHLGFGDERSVRIRNFFTFRKPQPDYFRGPTQPDMWSWLEVYPQHVFRNARGEKEQMSVGVGQNAVRGRLGSMSEPGVCGRSFHNGKAAQKPEDVLWGYNLAEQFEHALKQEPQFIFITGWNEWIAGRHPEFNGVRGDMFPDTYDQENSRDIEPMKGGHGDNYYYQMVSFIRRFKGVRPPPKGRGPQSMRLDRDFGQWAGVRPEFRDDIGDTVHRDFPGFNNCARYTNSSGRNDFVELKVAHDRKSVYFYARTREPITGPTEPGWMMLLIDADQNRSTGWEGYDFILNRVKHNAATGVLERNSGGWKWAPVGEVKLVVKGTEMQLAIPRSALGMAPGNAPLRFNFKWADNVPESGDILDFVGNGDVAPNGRFNYQYEGGE